MKTFWCCEKCQSVGIVEHDDHIGVWEMFNRISDDHHLTNADCHQSDHGLQVVDLEAVFLSDPALYHQWVVLLLAALIKKRLPGVS